MSDKNAFCPGEYGGRRCQKRPHKKGLHVYIHPLTGIAEMWPPELDEEWQEVGRECHSTQESVLGKVASATGFLSLPDWLDVCPEKGCGGQMVQRGACKQCSICGYGGSCG